MQTINALPSSDLSSTDCYGEGYEIGKRAVLGEYLPHPENWPHPEMMYHGMRAALRGRDLNISMFLVVIPSSTS